MKNKQHTLPSFFLISSAVDGNENAIEKLLLFYEAYISKCCLRPFYDEYGNVYIVVDMELKGCIREALLKMMLAKGISGILSYTKEGIRLWLGLLKYLYS